MTKGEEILRNIKKNDNRFKNLKIEKKPCGKIPSLSEIFDDEEEIILDNNALTSNNNTSKISL